MTSKTTLQKTPLTRPQTPARTSKNFVFINAKPILFAKRRKADLYYLITNQCIFYRFVLRLHTCRTGPFYDALFITQNGTLLPKYNAPLFLKFKRRSASARFHDLISICCTYHIPQYSCSPRAPCPALAFSIRPAPWPPFRQSPLCPQPRLFL